MGELRTHLQTDSQKRKREQRRVKRSQRAKGGRARKREKQKDKPWEDKNDRALMTRDTQEHMGARG